MPSILIVDDEPNILKSLTGALGREGYLTETAGTLADAREQLREWFDFVLLDVRLPDGSGVDLLGEIMGATPDTAVIMMSGHATIDVAVQATRLGAYDFLEKPIALERLLVLLRNASAARSLEAENRRLRQPWGMQIIGQSAAVERLLEEIRRAGPSSSRVLIQGENGTGKELVARALHASSPRAGQPFVAFNCAAIPDELTDSELFGHERGAFTGAMQSRRGRFEEADHGTLFLDEVSELSTRAQAKLLRVLQEHELTRVGGSRTIRVDVRVIAATNRDLAARVREGAFREDLYFRLAVIPIMVPPLRERAEDIPMLVEHISERIRDEMGVPRKTFSPAALELLGRHAFPGNIRELRNLVERLQLTISTRIGSEHIREVLPQLERSESSDSRLSDRMRAYEKQQIEAALRAAGGNVTQAAERLGLERSHFYKKMKQLGVRPE